MVTHDMNGRTQRADKFVQVYYFYSYGTAAWLGEIYGCDLRFSSN